jgi:hypothetical protein
VTTNGPTAHFLAQLLPEPPVARPLQREELHRYWSRRLRPGALPFAARQPRATDRYNRAKSTDTTVSSTIAAATTLISTNLRRRGLAPAAGRRRPPGADPAPLSGPDCPGRDRRCPISRTSEVYGPIGKAAAASHRPRPPVSGPAAAAGAQ